MKKEELIALLRSAGVDENTVTFASNVYDIGYEAAKEELKQEVDDEVP